MKTFYIVLLSPLIALWFIWRIFWLGFWHCEKSGRIGNQMMYGVFYVAVWIYAGLYLWELVKLISKKFGIAIDK